MAQYYIGRDNQRLGPFEVHQLLSNGLTPDTLVWCNGMAGWQMAKDVPELSGLFVAQQPQYQQPQYQQYQQPQYQQPAYQQPQYQQQPAYMAGAYQQPMGGGSSNRQKVDMFIMANKDNFPAEKIPYIQERLSYADENTINSLSMLQFKSPMTALLLSIFIGHLGIDRFYIGDTGMGVGKLVTFGGCLIWYFIDLFLIMGATREKNYDMIAPYLP